MKEVQIHKKLKGLKIMPKSVYTVTLMTLSSFNCYLVYAWSTLVEGDEQPYRPRGKSTHS